MSTSRRVTLNVRTVPPRPRRGRAAPRPGPRRRPVTWLRRGDGLVGWGVAAEVRTHGATRFADADKWWSETTARADVHDEVGEPGTGLVAFGILRLRRRARRLGARRAAGRRRPPRRRRLADHGRRRGRRRPAPAEPPAAPVARELRRRRPQRRAVDVGRRRRRRPDQPRRPREGRARPRPGRDRRASRSTSAGRCAGSPSSYPMCWTFHVDGMFGATPEMLVRRERGLVTSRVLAGTIRRTGDDERDLALAATLARSSKDLEEHEYAVRSVADALEPHCSSMNVPEAPFVLHLPNVMHLATDVAGVVHDAGHGVVAPARRGAAPLGRRRRHADPGRHRADRRDRGHGPRPLRRPGRLDGRHRRRRVGHRAALGPARPATPCGSSPAAASSPTPTPRPSWPRPRRSSCRCGTR